MLEKKSRISKKEFNICMSKSKIIHSNNFYSRISFFFDFKDSHFAVVAPKKIFKKAHERNKARRIAYSFINKSLKNIKFAKPFCLILFLKKSFFNNDKEKLENEIFDFLHKLR